MDIQKNVIPVIDAALDPQVWTGVDKVTWPFPDSGIDRAIVRELAKCCLAFPVAVLGYRLMVRSTLRATVITVGEAAIPSALLYWYGRPREASKRGDCWAAMDDITGMVPGDGLEEIWIPNKALEGGLRKVRVEDKSITGVLIPFRENNTSHAVVFCTAFPGQMETSLFWHVTKDKVEGVDCLTIELAKFLKALVSAKSLTINGVVYQIGS